MDFAGSIVLMFTSFSTTPFVLQHLSDTSYGFWMIVVQILGFMGVLEMGASIAVIQKAADSRLAEDREQLSTLMTSCLAIQLVTAGLVLAVGLSLSGQIFVWFDVDPASIPGSIGAFRAMVCWFALGLVLALYPALLAARQRIDLANSATFVNQLLATLLPLPLLAVGWGVGSFPVAQWVAGLTGFGLAAYWISRKVSPFRFHFRHLHARSIKSVLDFSFYNWIGKLAFLIIAASDNILIGALLGTSAVTPFLLTSKLSTVIAPNMARLVGSAMPGFAELFATGEKERLQANVISLYRLCFRVAFFGAMLVLCINERFVATWVGESRFAGMAFTSLLAFMCLIDTFTKGTGVVIVASGDMKGFGLIRLLEAIAKISLAYLLMKRLSLGLNGLLLAQLISSLLFSGLYFPSKTLRLTGLKPVELFLRGFATPLLKSLPSLTCLAVLSWIIPANWGWLGIVSICGTAVLVNLCLFELPVFISATNGTVRDRVRAAFFANL